MVRTFKIHSLSNFQLYNTALLVIITVLCSRSPELTRQKPSALRNGSDASNALCSVEYCDCLFQTREMKPHLMGEAVGTPVALLSMIKTRGNLLIREVRCRQLQYLQDEKGIMKLLEILN